jgi:hypothetical protein
MIKVKKWNKYNSIILSTPTLSCANNINQAKPLTCEYAINLKTVS